MLLEECDDVIGAKRAEQCVFERRCLVCETLAVHAVDVAAVVGVYNLVCKVEHWYYDRCVLNKTTCGVGNSLM